MITKQQSKKMNQLKYLVLIPLLMSMLLYSSCAEIDDQTESNQSSNQKKSTQITYMEAGGKVMVGRRDRETYLDSYFGMGTPEGVEVTYDDLTNNEREEFEVEFDRLKNLEHSDRFSHISVKIYEKNNGRKTLARIVDVSKIKIPKSKAKMYPDGSYSVLNVRVTPTFPGCDETKRDLDCFFKKLDTHFKDQFDLNKVKNLGLASGKNKVLVSFNIDENGKAVDIDVEASHIEVTKEAIKTIRSLPKMNGGEREGKLVKVKYILPFTFIID